jgi:hypothetical protein
VVVVVVVVGASTAVMIVGGVALLSGVVLLATVPSKNNEPKALPAGLAMNLEVTPMGFRVRGAF